MRKIYKYLKELSEAFMFVSRYCFSSHKKVPFQFTIAQKLAKYVVRCAICYNLYNLKNVKNTRPWVFFTFFKLYKWYQIAQRITYFEN